MLFHIVMNGFIFKYLINFVLPKIRYPTEHSISSEPQNPLIGDYEEHRIGQLREYGGLKLWNVLSGRIIFRSYAFVEMSKLETRFITLSTGIM